MCVCMYACMYAFMHLCMNACMHALCIEVRVMFVHDDGRVYYVVADVSKYAQFSWTFILLRNSLSMSFS